MIKKCKSTESIISAVLSIILVCSVLTACPVFAADKSEDTAEAEQKEIYGAESYGLLNALEIAEIREEELAADAARGDVLVYMAKAAGLAALKSDEKPFADMETSDEREPYIKSLYKSGVIRPDSKGNIYPDGKITLQEAAAIAVKLTGYGIAAEENGGYPSGYLKIAGRYDILSGLPGGDPALTKGMAAKLTVNMLKTEVMTQTYSVNGSSEYRAESGSTLLYTVFNVKYINGIVEAVDISQIAGGNETDMDYVIIGGEKLEASKIENNYDFLGYDVDAYYKVSSSSAVARLIYIRKSELNNEVSIDTDDIVSASAGKIKVNEGNSRNSRVYAFKKSLPVIYNGVSTRKTFSNEMIDNKYGKVRLLDNSGDGGYDVILIDVYENFIASDIIKKDSKVYDKYDNTHSITLDLGEDDPFVWIYDKDGKKISLDSIRRNSVLSIYSSLPDAAQGYIRAYVNSTSEKGIITQTRSNNKIFVGDKEYTVTDDCAAKCEYYIKAGTAISFKTDICGRIAYIESDDSSGTYQYGFIVKAAKLKGIDYELQFKIFDANDSFSIYNIADRLKIDSVAYKSSDVDAILSKLNKASGAMFNKTAADGSITEQVPDGCYSSLVRFKINDDGKLSAIDTVLNNEMGIMAEREDKADSDDALFMQYAPDAACRGTMLGGKIAFTTAAPLMSYPSPLAMDPDTGTYFDMSNEENYTVLNAYKKFNSSDKYSVYGFYTNENSFVSDFLGMVYDPNVSESGADYRTPLSVVSDAPSKLYDEESETVIECLNVNGSVQVPVKSGFTFTDGDGTLDPDLPKKMSIRDLEKGDIIKYTTDTNGYLSDLQLVYRINGKKFVDKTEIIDQEMHWGSVRCGYVYLKFEGGMLVYVPSNPETFSPENMSSVKAKDCIMILDTGSYSLWIYGEDRPGEYKVKSGTINDLKAFRDVGTDCSEVMIQRYYEEIKAIVRF